MNQFLTQYFVTYNMKHGWFLTESPIITSNWLAPDHNKWLVPFGAASGKSHGSVSACRSGSAGLHVERANCSPVFSCSLTVVVSCEVSRLEDRQDMFSAISRSFASVKTSGRMRGGYTPRAAGHDNFKRTGVYTMCDYSLQGVPNRLAVEGEELITYRFPTGSVGLATPTDIAAAKRPKPHEGCRRSWWSALKHWLDPQIELDRVPAVCLPPGAHLFMNHIPEVLRLKCALQAVEDVTFVQLSADANRYRDGIQFRNGKQVLLQEIAEGVRFEVLSLACRQEKEAEPQRVPDPVVDCLITTTQ